MTRATIAALILTIVLGLVGVADAVAGESRFMHHGGRWARLAHCESTHRWRIDDGGLQIIESTWRAYTGSSAPQEAEDASRDFQVKVAKRIAWHGFGKHEPQGGANAWPYCWRATR